MTDSEAEEQLRDWMKVGLAADLKLDINELVDNFYDTFPVRDNGFAGLSRQPVGPGRSLYSDGVLHLLVSKDDPHRDRTIGLLLDQYRTDSGSDPRQVQLHRYTVHPDIESIHIEPDQPAATNDFRGAHGYVRTRIDSSRGLTDFLARTRALSTIELVGDELWAGGWRWADGDGQRLTREDVAVLQRAYDTASSDTTPGFSLDPGPVETVDDLTAVIPGLSAELLDGVLYDDWAGATVGSVDELTEGVETALFGELTEVEITALGLPTDRMQLWALWSYLLGDSPYGEARYDGDLQGTEVGMTLFYTDYVAKDWVNGVGTGVPTDAVQGFEPDTVARTPWAHCADTDDAAAESGRLWFGANDGAYSVQSDRLTIGAQPARLFVRSDGEASEEVESSYSFGRGLSWWDQHYQAVADYEPQYQRLDQIMRWSAALDWLSEKTAKLPSYTAVDIREDLTFADWYRDHDDLRERAQISFVTPPSAGDESVMTVPSEKFDDGGWVNIHGGVTLADLGAQMARAAQTDLPGPVRRAGVYDEASLFDPASGNGSMKLVSLDEKGGVSAYLGHAISRPGKSEAHVDVTASPRSVISLGKLKVWLDKIATRAATVDLRGGGGTFSQQVRFQGYDLGGITAVKQGELITLRWRSGIVDRMRNAAESLQNRLSSGQGGAPVDGVLYSIQDTNGRMLYRVGSGDEPWLAVTAGAPAGANLALRLGSPGPEGLPQFSYATLVSEPALPPGEWTKVTPAAKDVAASAIVANAPPRDASAVRVSTRDGHVSTLYAEGDSVWVPTDDPVLGRHGTAEAAALQRDFPRVAAAMRDAVSVGDGLLRGVSFGGDGVALVGAKEVLLVGAADRWATKLDRVIGPDPSRPALFAVVDDQLVHQDAIPLRAVEGSREEVELGDVLNRDATVLIDDALRATFPDGPLVADALPRGLEVVVAEFVVARDDIRVDTAAQPDVWVHGDERWWRVVDSSINDGTGVDPGNGGGSDEGSGGGSGDGSGDGSGQVPQTVPTSTTSSTSPTSPSTTPAARRPTKIILVCAEDDAEVCAA